MKQLKKDLQAVLKALQQATDRVEKLLIKVEALENSQQAVKGSKEPKTSAGAGSRVRKSGKTTDGEAVLAVIKRFKKGIDLATLRKKTGFEGRKMGDIIYRLKKTGKIKVVGKGVYVKA